MRDTLDLFNCARGRGDESEDMFIMKKSLIIVFGFILIGSGGFYFYNKYYAQDGISAINTEKPVIRDIVQYINATGNLRARDQISVGSLVTGKVIEIHAEDNDIVKDKQLLAALDDGVGDSEVKNLTAALKEAKANLSYQKQFFARQKALYKSGQLSKNLFEQYTKDYEVARTKVTQTASSLEKAKKTYDNLFIRSPVNGIVIAKKIDLGQMVASQLNATVLFEIAKELQHMEAYVDVDEADIGMVHVDQTAIFTVDSFPKQKFEAKVKRIQYQAKIVDNVVTYATVLDVHNPELRLRPGMTTNVDIKVADVKQVLAIPNKALRIGTLALEENAKNLKYTVEKEYESGGVAKTRAAKSGGKASRASRDILWVLDGTKVRQVEVVLGVTDGKFTEVKQGITPQSNVVVELGQVKRENVLLKGIFGKPAGGIGSK